MAAALQFDPDSHRYTFGDKAIPSVTQILDPYTGLDFVDRATLEAARELGSRVHEAVHLYNIGQLGECPADLIPYVDGWTAFLSESGAVVTASEYRVYSAKHGYAGTLDNLAHWKDRDTLIDVKSGSVVPKTVGPQTAAYVTAWNEMHGTRFKTRYCVHLKGDGRYKVHPLTDATDWHIFQSALNLHKWRYP